MDRKSAAEGRVGGVEQVYGLEETVQPETEFEGPKNEYTLKFCACVCVCVCDKTEIDAEIRRELPHIPSPPLA